MANLGGTSTNTAGLEAISKALAQFSDQHNIGAISTLNGQMQQLARSMGIKELPVLIAHLEKLGAITREQGNELRKLNQAPSHVSKLGNEIGRLANPVNAFSMAASGAAQMVLRFVEKANPAAAFQFNRALDDLAGTLGQILTPILEGATVLIRTYADALQGLRPAIEPIMQSVKQLMVAVAPLIQSVMELAGPGLEILGLVLQDLVVPAVKTLADAMRDLVEFLKDAIEVITFGAIEFDRFKAKSSVNAAVRPASYSKDIEDVGKRTTLAALTQGTSGLSKDATEITKNQMKTNDILAGLADKIADRISQVLREKLGVNKEQFEKGKKIGSWVLNPSMNLFREMRKALND